MKPSSLLACLLPIALFSCSPKPQATIPETANFQPGLGEMMSLTQMRHAKLGLAGMNENWELAAYELDELKEGFEDIIRIHPTHKDAPRPLNTLLPAVMSLPLSQLQEAITTKNGRKFIPAYDLLTTACNGCHQAENHGFIVIKQPDPRAYSNQEFLPRR